MCTPRGYGSFVCFIRRLASGLTHIVNPQRCTDPVSDRVSGANWVPRFVSLPNCYIYAFLLVMGHFVPLPWPSVSCLGGNELARYPLIHVGSSSLMRASRDALLMNECIGTPWGVPS